MGRAMVVLRAVAPEPDTAGEMERRAGSFLVGGK